MLWHDSIARRVVPRPLSHNHPLTLTFPKAVILSQLVSTLYVRPELWKENGKRTQLVTPFLDFRLSGARYFFPLDCASHVGPFLLFHTPAAFLNQTLMSCQCRHLGQKCHCCGDCGHGMDD